MEAEEDSTMTAYKIILIAVWCFTIPVMTVLADEKAEIELLLNILDAAGKTPLAGARVQYRLGVDWHNFSGAVSGASSAASGDKQVNYTCRAAVQVDKGQRSITFLVRKTGYNYSVFRIDLRKLKPDRKVYREVLMKKHGYVDIALFMKVGKEGGKALAGARAQYYWVNEWYDFTSGKGSTDVSNDRFTELGENARKWKGREANYTVIGKIPRKDRKHNDNLFRVIRPDYTVDYFKVQFPRKNRIVQFYRDSELESIGLVAEWPLKEGKGGTVLERTGRTNPGRVLGASWVKDGDGEALEFDGLDDSVDCGVCPGYECSEAITVLAWIKPAGEISILQGLVGRAWLNPYALSVGEVNALRSTVFLDGFGFLSIAKDNVIIPGEWNYVGFTYEGNSSLVLWHNGKKAAEKDLSRVRHLGGTRPYRIFVPSGRRLSIGYFDGLAHFAGRIKGVKIFNHALNEDRVQEIYKSEVSE